QPGRSDGGDVFDVVLPRLVDHARNRVDRPGHRRFLQLAGLVETLAQPRHLGAVGDGRPRTVGLPLGDHELDRVRPDVDDCVSQVRTPGGAFRPRARPPFGSGGRPSSRTAATTNAGFSDSTAIVRVDLPLAPIADSSAIAPPTVKWSRCLCTST